MELERGENLMIDSSKVIEEFNSEDIMKKD
jgi:hypothetical protein